MLPSFLPTKMYFQKQTYLRTCLAFESDINFVLNGNKDAILDILCKIWSILCKSKAEAFAVMYIRQSCQLVSVSRSNVFASF